jgi:ubiquinone/menaquinone biosynthesis C-methylase UbiE
MASLEDTWGRARLVASAYDFAVHNPLVGRIAAYALWGFDIRKLHASIARISTAAPGTRVLDVPCGGGLVFSALAKDHGLDYTAFDFSPVMLERASRQRERLGLSGIRFQQGDVGALPQASGSVDLCLTYNGIHCFPEPQRAVRELTRVLAPGGVLRGTLVVHGAGLRYDTVIRLFRQRGWFGPCCSRDDLLDWLLECGMQVTMEERNGGFMVFEAVKIA